jgi:hypothetical protein
MILKLSFFFLKFCYNFWRYEDERERIYGAA